MYSCIVISKVVEMQDRAHNNNDRKAWMSLLAKTSEGQITSLVEAQLDLPGFTWLRRPEFGSVMVQGRTGGVGTAFNLGEMTVTRCALRLNCGAVGHAYIQGRRKPDAQAAAIVDAMMQTAAADLVRNLVLDPLAQDRAEKRAVRAAKAAATKVDFFTMARGSD